MLCLVQALGVPLRVGLCAAMACLYGQPISAAIPNAVIPYLNFKGAITHHQLFKIYVYSLDI
jgi:hypothetical protein